MNGIVRPKGRASAGIYWRRRLVLLGVLLLATAGAVKVVGGGGDEPDASASSAAGHSQDSDTSGADAKHARGPHHKRSPNKEPSGRDVRSGERDVALTMRPGPACNPARVSVRPSVGPDAYAGGPVTLRLGLSTSGDKPCVLSLDEHTPLVSVSAAGGDLVWTSQRCDDLVGVDEVRLEPGWLSYVDARWSGRASEQTCGENARFATPGDYAVEAALLGGEPSKATISLDEPPKDDSDKDEKDDKNDKSDKNDKNDKSDKNDKNDDEQEQEQDGDDKGGSER